MECAQALVCFQGGRIAAERVQCSGLCAVVGTMPLAMCFECFEDLSVRMYGAEMLCLNRACPTNHRQCNSVLRNILTLAGDFDSVFASVESREDEDYAAIRLVVQSQSEWRPETNSQLPVLAATSSTPTGVLSKSSACMPAEAHETGVCQWTASRDLALYAASRERQREAKPDEIVWTQIPSAKKKQKKR